MNRSRQYLGAIKPRLIETLLVTLQGTLRGTRANLQSLSSFRDFATVAPRHLPLRGPRATCARARPLLFYVRGFWVLFEVWGCRVFRDVPGSGLSARILKRVGASGIAGLYGVGASFVCSLEV